MRFDFARLFALSFVGKSSSSTILRLLLLLLGQGSDANCFACNLLASLRTHIGDDSSSRSLTERISTRIVVAISE